MSSTSTAISSNGVGYVAPSAPNSSGGTAPAASGDAPATLPPPDFSVGDPIATIATLLVKSAQQKKKNDDLSADTEDKAEDAADAKRVEELKSKADCNLAAGIAAGASQIGEGAMKMNAGTIGMTGPDDLNTKGRMEYADGQGTSIGGNGKIVEAGFKYAADMHDVAATKAENESKVHKRAADALRKESDAAAQHVQKVTQLLQDIKTAQAQAEHAALLKM